MIDTKCAHCGEVFQTYPSRPDRKFCSRKCSDLGRTRPQVATQVEIRCATCGETFRVSPSRKAAARFCSHACYAESLHGRTPSNGNPPETRECAHCGEAFQSGAARKTRFCSRACSAAARRGLPAHNAKPSESVTCVQCGASFAVPEGNAHDRRFCSTTCVNVWKRSIRNEQHPLFKPKVEMACEMCGKIVAVRPSIVPRFRFCSRRCSGAWVATTWPRTSSIELAVQGALSDRGVEYATEYRIGQYAIDVAIIPARIAIEVDGKYWHSRPTQIVKDRRKDTYLINHGWRIVRLAEDDIRADLSACIDRVMALAQCPISE